MLLGLLSGGLFGAIMTGSLIARHGCTLGAILLGVGQGAAFGAVMGPLLARQQRRVLGEVAGLPADRRRAIMQAAKGGPLPEDRSVLAAARAVTARQYEQVRKQRFGSTTLFGGLALLSLGLALAGDLRWLLACVFFVSMIGLTWWSVQRLRRRLLVLEGYDPVS